MNSPAAGRLAWRFLFWGTLQQLLVWAMRLLTVLVAFWNGGLSTATLTAVLILVWTTLAKSLVGRLIQPSSLIPQLVLFVVFLPVVETYWVIRLAVGLGTIFNVFTFAIVFCEVGARLSASRAVAY